MLMPMRMVVLMPMLMRVAVVMRSVMAMCVAAAGAMCVVVRLCTGGRCGGMVVPVPVSVPTRGPVFMLVLMPMLVVAGLAMRMLM